MGRPSYKHVDSEELNALVPARFENEGAVRRLSPAEVSEAHLHVRSCPDCREKLERYRMLVDGVSNVDLKMGARGPDCPAEEDVSWHEIAAGLWPELKSRQLILHAATCDYCGPQLRAAVRQRDAQVNQDPTGSKLAQGTGAGSVDQASVWSAARWVAAAVALVFTVAWWSARSPLPSRPLSGAQIAELAVLTHRQYAQGNIALKMRTDSRKNLNEWLRANTGLVVPVPGSIVKSDEQPAYRLKGAQLLPVGSHTAAYISYAANTPGTAPADVGLIVTPDSMGVASGGVEVDFPKVRFHYSTVDGYKVVTWSAHGVTYALVSQEDMRAQRSCLVCHNSSNDPALHRAPTHSGLEKISLPVWQ